MGLGPVHGKKDAITKALKPTMGEIRIALKKICESHDLQFVQASIIYDQTLIPSASSSSVDLGQSKKKFGVSLLVPCVDDEAEEEDDDDYRLVFNDICESVDMIPLTTGKQLAEKAFQISRPHFSPNIFELTDDEDLPPGTGNKKLCSLALCMRSDETVNVDFVLEFFWPRHRNSFTLIESIITRLKKRLPSLRFSSGVELGNETTIVEVGDSDVEEFYIFVGGKLSGMPQVSAEGKDNTHLSKTNIESQFNKTQKDAAKSLGVSVYTLKRKCGDFNIDHWKRTKKSKTKVND